MKKNILRCSFVLKIAVILWTISFGSNVLAADYITNLDLEFTSCASDTVETVDATLSEGGGRILTASGYIEGTLTFSNCREVNINTGSHAGWAWRRCSYSLSGYSGEGYSIHNNTLGKVWGHMTGDIHAAVRRVGNTRTLYITSVSGVQTTGTIYLEYVSSTGSATVTEYNNTDLYIKGGIEQKGTASGHYSGPYSGPTANYFFEAIRMPAFQPEPGFSRGTHKTNLGTGNGWAYHDERDATYADRWLTLDEPMFGINFKRWIFGCSIGKQVTGTIEHVLGGSASVPAGSDIIATIPVSPTSEIAVNFENVSSGGSVTAQKTSSTPSPSSYSIVGSVYDITTTASYSGTVQVCLSYNDSDVIGPESDLKLLHYTGSEWETLSSSVDTANNIVCGSASSLSPFGIGGSGSSTTSGSRVPVFNGWWLLMGIFPGLFLILRRVRRG